MLPVGEKVILVTASSPKGTASASITYSLAEMYETEIEESGVMSSSESDAMFTDSWPDSVFQPLENIARMWRRQALISDAERGLDSKHLTPRLHLALGGKTLDVIRKHFPQLLQRILVRATILARMTPDQKTKVIFHMAVSVSANLVTIIRFLLFLYDRWLKSFRNLATPLDFVVTELMIVVLSKRLT